MRMELPECKRCCFCLPLRYGLITWGYLKLAVCILVSPSLFFTLYHMVDRYVQTQFSFILNEIILVCIVLSIILTDGVLNTIFIIGGHMKNVKLLRVYYIYNIVLWVLTLLLVLFWTFLMMPISPSMLGFRMYILMVDLATSFLSIIMQTYFILLLRSEIVKLSSNCEFRFVNNAADAECTMRYNEVGDVVEKGIEDDCEIGSSEKRMEKNLKNKMESSINNYEILTDDRRPL